MMKLLVFSLLFAFAHNKPMTHKEMARDIIKNLYNTNPEFKAYFLNKVNDEVMKSFDKESSSQEDELLENESVSDLKDETQEKKTVNDNLAEVLQDIPKNLIDEYYAKREAEAAVDKEVDATNYRDEQPNKESASFQLDQLFDETPLESNNDVADSMAGDENYLISDSQLRPPSWKYRWGRTIDKLPVSNVPKPTEKDANEGLDQLSLNNLPEPASLTQDQKDALKRKVREKVRDYIMKKQNKESDDAALDDEPKEDELNDVIKEKFKDALKRKIEEKYNDYLSQNELQSFDEVNSNIDETDSMDAFDELDEEKSKEIISERVHDVLEKRIKEKILAKEKDLMSEMVRDTVRKRVKEKVMAEFKKRENEEIEERVSDEFRKMMEN